VSSGSLQQPQGLLAVRGKVVARSNYQVTMLAVPSQRQVLLKKQLKKIFFMVIGTVCIRTADRSGSESSAQVAGSKA
jgi:hypothetical protein